MSNYNHPLEDWVVNTSFKPEGGDWQEMPDLYEARIGTFTFFSVEIPRGTDNSRGYGRKLLAEKLARLLED